MDEKRRARLKRQVRIKKKIRGSGAAPRLSVFRSLKNIYAQLVDDSSGKILISASSLSSDFKAEMPYGGNISSAGLVGKLLAKRCGSAGIKKVVFDRGGFLYHGRIKALAEAAREGGLEF